MNLSTVFPGASPKALRKTAVLALILALAAHGFCFFNLTYSGESVMLNAAKGSASQIASGTFLMPLYWRVRGAISAPLPDGISSVPFGSVLETEQKNGDRVMRRMRVSPSAMSLGFTETFIPSSSKVYSTGTERDSWAK